MDRRGTVTALADAAMRRHPPAKLSWGWGEGLFVWALARGADDGSRGLAYAEEYVRAHARRGLPTIDWSDRCAPGLAAAEVYARTGDRDAFAAAERVAGYLRAARPLACGVLAHFGAAPRSRVYPRSAWVDSMMMYVVFAARWGALVHDARLVELAANHARAFGRALQDDATGLWAHAYFPRAARRLPGGGAFWLRGNGWALASLAELLATLPDDEARAALASRHARTARALSARRDASGLWPTLLGRPSYLETSGSALVAWGLAAAPDRSLHVAGRAALDAVVARIEWRRGAASLGGISAETMPYPAFVYPRIPRVRDRLYGVAAVLLAARAAAAQGADVRDTH